jgi:hypothetical protein
MLFRQKYFAKTASFIFSVAMLAAFVTATRSHVQAAAGRLKNTLDGNGKLATDFNGFMDYATDVLVQPDGKIVASGIIVGASSQRGNL